MKYYAQAIEFNNLGLETSTCGTGGVFILDGRNNLSNMVIDAKNWFNKSTKHINKRWIGFIIHRGSRFDDKNYIEYTYRVPNFLDHMPSDETIEFYKKLCGVN